MKKLVIIGGGFAGSYIAKKLEGKLDVTLIDNKDYFEFTPSILRTIIDPSHAKKIQTLHSHYLHKSKIVRGKVVNVGDKVVKTTKGEFSYDYLAICSGSHYDSPIKEENIVAAARGKELREYHQKLVKAKDVLIIGGGIVGVELAAEIVSAFSDKRVTIVHSKSELIERASKKARDYVKKYLTNRGVKIIFNDRIEKGVSGVDGSFKTKKDVKVESDLTFLCVGIKANSKHLKECSIDLNERDYVCVNKYLQVRGRSNVFAAGDITNINEEKLAQNAQKQACVVVENILRLEKGSGNLEEYVSKKRPMVISLGKWDGVVVFGKFVVKGLIAALLKEIVEFKAMRMYR
jgi:apoptosis-inducing factor 2